MNLTDKQIEDFQKIYKNEYGHDISKDDARKYGTKLIDLIKFAK
jgi:hypothetical protein